MASKQFSKDCFGSDPAAPALSPLPVNAVAWSASSASGSSLDMCGTMSTCTTHRVNSSWMTSPLTNVPTSDLVNSNNVSFTMSVHWFPHACLERQSASGSNTHIQHQTVLAKEIICRFHLARKSSSDDPRRSIYCCTFSNWRLKWYSQFFWATTRPYINVQQPKQKSVQTYWLLQIAKRVYAFPCVCLYWRTTVPPPEAPFQQRYRWKPDRAHVEIRTG